MEIVTFALPSRKEVLDGLRREKKFISVLRFVLVFTAYVVMFSTFVRIKQEVKKEKKFQILLDIKMKIATFASLHGRRRFEVEREIRKKEFIVVLI
jgi:hypothetical protein